MSLAVIIKTKNSENTLCDALESIKKCDEIVLIDENSSDDTILIAKEYKAKVIYSIANEIDVAFKQALDEIESDWIFVLEDDEVVSDNLLNEIIKYIENPKKHILKFDLRLFYLNKEIKSAKKSVIRVFKKGYCKNKNTYSLELKPKTKVHKIKNYYIHKYEKNIFNKMKAMVEICNFNLKSSKNLSSSLFLKPLFHFLYYYILKLGIMEAKEGFIHAFLNSLKIFLVECAKYERQKNDI